MVSVKSGLPAAALVAEIEICKAAEITGFGLYPELQPARPTTRTRSVSNSVLTSLMSFSVLGLGFPLALRSAGCRGSADIGAKHVAAQWWGYGPGLFWL